VIENLYRNRRNSLKRGPSVARSLGEKPDAAIRVRFERLEAAKNSRPVVYLHSTELGGTENREKILGKWRAGKGGARKKNKKENTQKKKKQKKPKKKKNNNFKEGGLYPEVEPEDRSKSKRGKQKTNRKTLGKVKSGCPERKYEPNRRGEGGGALEGGGDGRFTNWASAARRFRKGGNETWGEE